MTGERRDTSLSLGRPRRVATAPIDRWPRAAAFASATRRPNEAPADPAARVAGQSTLGESMKCDELPTFLTADETATLLRTTRKGVYVMIERAQLPGVTRIGRRVLIHSGDLLDWLRQKSAPSLKE